MKNYIGIFLSNDFEVMAQPAPHVSNKQEYERIFKKSSHPNNQSIFFNTVTMACGLLGHQLSANESTYHDGYISVQRMPHYSLAKSKLI